MVFLFLFCWFPTIFMSASAAEPKPSKPAAAEETDSSRSGDNTEAQNLGSSLLQQEVMDFSDEYVSAMWYAIDEYIRNEPDPKKRVIAQSWKVIYGSASMTIAASVDPRASLLDMAVFISAGRWAVKSYWVPKVFGKGASRLDTVYEEMDRKIWEKVSRLLTPGQVRDLKKLVTAWKEANPGIYEVADVRLRNLDGVQLSQFDSSPTARGILVALRKMLGKVDQSLLYGERVMFYLERTPRVLNQQTDLTLAQIAEAFPLASLRADTLVASLENLPQQITDGLVNNQDLAREMLPEVRSTLDSAGKLTLSLNDTLQTVQVLSKDLGQLPFTIQDATVLLKQTEQTADKLDSVLGRVDTILATKGSKEGEPRVMELVRVADERVDHLLDAVFQRVLILIGVFFVGVVAVLVFAKLLFARRNNPQS